MSIFGQHFNYKKKLAGATYLSDEQENILTYREIIERKNLDICHLETRVKITERSFCSKTEEIKILENSIDRWKKKEGKLKSSHEKLQTTLSARMEENENLKNKLQKILLTKFFGKFQFFTKVSIFDESFDF